MNAPENKRMLWELTNHLYKAWMARDQVITLFEKTIAEVDEGSDPLIEKNKRFLTVYIERVAAIQPQDAQQRAAAFGIIKMNMMGYIKQVPQIYIDLCNEYKITK